MAPFTGYRTHSPPQSTDVPPQGLVPSWFRDPEINCLEAIKQILLSSWHNTTRIIYINKWTRFRCWCASHQMDAAHALLPFILDYILRLKSSGLANSSIRLQLEAITTFHSPIDGHSVFTHVLMKCFLIGIQNLYPCI